MRRFVYNTSNIINIRNSLSEERLARYLYLAKGNIKLALDLHLRNAYWGSLLHLPIQHFELLLRNSLNRELVRTFGHH